jgi:hypothetical protein
MPREKRKEYIAYVPNNGAQRGDEVYNSNYEKIPMSNSNATYMVYNEPTCCERIWSCLLLLWCCRIFSGR